jgi:hypothetical protein
LLQLCELGPSLACIVAAVTLGHIIAIMTLDNIVAFDTIVAFVIPLVALLTSAPMMWCEECL